MLCVKCGKKTEDDRMFCARCLEGMEAYPVKPDVHVQLPVHRKETAVKKQHSKGRRNSGNARIAALQRQNRLLLAVVVALLLAVAVLLIRDARILKLG